MSVNYLQVSISIKQLSKALRENMLGKFIEDDHKCQLFINLARQLGFTFDEVKEQIINEREYIKRMRSKDVVL